MSRIVLLAAIAVSLCACGGGEEAGKKHRGKGGPDAEAKADADGDGFDSIEAGGDDCDDTRPGVHPGSRELCDGIDNNCDGLVDDADPALDDPAGLTRWWRDWDQDGYGDGTSDFWRYCAQPLGGVSNGDDCDDLDPELNAADLDQDGSSTCDGDCDDTDPAVEALDLDGDGRTTCQDDCDDLDPDLDPRDRDGDGYSSCSGDCDDDDDTVGPFDLDGDGYDACADGDCDDTDPWLNPFDGDGDGASTCGGDCDDNDPALNALDSDGDGVDICSGDCDDADPTRYPGVLELYGDAVDGDCDGGVDTTPFGFGTVRWLDPRPPRVVRTDGHYVVVSAGDWVDLTSSVKPWLGAAMTFDPTAGFLAAPVAPVVQWLGAAAPLPLGGAVDAVASGPDFTGAATYHFVGSNMYVTMKGMHWNAAAGAYTSASNEWYSEVADLPSMDVGIALDYAGDPWTVACGPTVLTALRGDGYTGGVQRGASSPVASGVCFWESEPLPFGPDGGLGKIVSCEPVGGCTLYDFDATNETIAPAAINTWAGRSLDAGRYRDGHVMVVDSGQPGLTFYGEFTPEQQVLTDWNLTAIDGVRASTPLGSRDVIVALGTPVVDDGLGPRIVVAVGDIYGPFDELVLPFEHPTKASLALSGVGVFADGDRIVVAASARDIGPYDPADCGTVPFSGEDYCVPDVVGWAFMGWP